MSSHRERSEPSMMDMLRNPGLEPVVQKHMRKVYTALGAATLASAVGCALQMSLGWNSPLLSFLVMMIAILNFSRLSTNSPWKFSSFLACGFAEGFALGPLLSIAFAVDPSIPFIAALGATAIFVSLSIAAIFAKRRSYLFLGGFLGSALSVLSLMSLVRLFWRGSDAVYFGLQIYGGLMMFCAYVLYDTQIIIEKVHAGDRDDYLKHALELFLDLAAIFVRLVIMLIRNNQRREEEDRRKRSRD